MHVEPLALLLLRASRWFDRQLLDGLAARGWPRLTPAQSLVFAHLGRSGTPPAELARSLGTSRQAAQDMVAGLVRLDLLQVRPDPERRGGRLVQMTERGEELARDAGEILARLESGLGTQRVEGLRSLLAELGAHEPSPRKVPTSDR